MTVQGFLLKLYIPLTTRAHSCNGSVLRLHHHFVIKDRFKALNDPTPISLGALTFSQDTQCTFFFSLHPPHKNHLWMNSSVFITPIGATNNEKKKVGRFPITTLISVSRPPNDNVFAFYKDRFEWNLLITGFQCFFKSKLAPTGTPR